MKFRLVESDENKEIIEPSSIFTYTGGVVTGNDGVVEVKISNTTTQIDEYAFKDCKNLKHVTIPNSVSVIGSYAFSGCTSLTSVDIPTSVKEIQIGAFKNCTSLTSITIPDSVKKISSLVFDGCTNLTIYCEAPYRGTWPHVPFGWSPYFNQSNRPIIWDYKLKQETNLAQSNQEYTSANTSINSSKLPAIFRLVKFTPDTINLDYGGGKFDNAAEYLKNKGNVTNLVYDPFNRSREHNSAVIKQIRANGGADSATLSNVLNVIKEPEIRLEVLNNIKSLLKPGATLYITVYEGTGKGDSGETKAGYQLNKKTADYVEEISQVFGDVTRKGKLIIAR